MNAQHLRQNLPVATTTTYPSRTSSRLQAPHEDNSQRSPPLPVASEQSRRIVSVSSRYLVPRELATKIEEFNLLQNNLLLAGFEDILLFSTSVIDASGDDSSLETGGTLM